MVDGLITGTVNLVLFGLVVLIRRRVHHEGLAAFGLHKDARGWRLLLTGGAAGTLLFSTYPIAAVAFGVGQVFVVSTALLHTLVLCASWGFGFAGVALFEEGLFRGYLLPKLRVKVSLAVAIMGQAVLFGAFHFMAYAARPYPWLGVLNTGVFAVAMALLVLRTRSLMAAVGFHVAWDLIETVLLRHQSSGVYTVLNLRITEGLWTGTALTPEAGLIVSLAVTGAAVLFCAHGRTTVRPDESALHGH